MNNITVVGDNIGAPPHLSDKGGGHPGEWGVGCIPGGLEGIPEDPLLLERQGFKSPGLEGSNQSGMISNNIISILR